MLGDLPNGSEVWDQAQIAVGHLAKYVGKGFLARGNIEGLIVRHRARVYSETHEAICSDYE